MVLCGFQWMGVYFPPATSRKFAGSYNHLSNLLIKLILNIPVHKEFWGGEGEFLVSNGCRFENSTRLLFYSRVLVVWKEVRLYEQ